MRRSSIILFVVSVLFVYLLAATAVAEDVAAPVSTTPWYASPAFASGCGAVFSVLYQVAKPALGAKLAGSVYGDLVLVVLAALAAGAVYLADTKDWGVAWQATLSAFTGALTMWAVAFSKKKAPTPVEKAEDAALGSKPE